MDVIRRRESAEDIERELNAQFNGKEYSVSNYQENDLDLTVETIHARPKFFPKEVDDGIANIEGDNLFTDLENEREDPTIKEKLWAMLTGQWITILRLNIDSGDAQTVRPPGLNFGHITATTSVRYQGYRETPHSMAPISPIRVADTHDLQSDKLEIKIQYNGSTGDYAERISDSIDLLQEIQDNMEYYATIYLLDFHDSGKKLNESGFSWPDKERAQYLSEYLFDHPVELDELEQFASEIKQNITNKR
jgi:hypothetical protein